MTKSSLIYCFTENDVEEIGNVKVISISCLLYGIPSHFKLVFVVVSVNRVASCSVSLFVGIFHLANKRLQLCGYEMKC
jgi:hypothetical protein